MAIEQFTYDLYSGLVTTANGQTWAVWHADVKSRETGERVYQTVGYNSLGDAVEAALDWIDDNMDNEDIG
jgi:hypothetical protein